jgi:hypothetical protein
MIAPFLDHHRDGVQKKICRISQALIDKLQIIERYNHSARVLGIEPVDPQQHGIMEMWPGVSMIAPEIGLL